MAKLSIHLFGAPRAELDGTPIVTDTRKAIALLAYLAVTRQAHTRDALATLLWPELDQTRARAALRRTLSALHAGRELPWLAIEREQVQLVTDNNLWCDVHEFERCVADCPPPSTVDGACGRCRPTWERAASFYTDDFLAGFTLRDSAAFDDWQFFQAESCRNTLARVLETLVRCASHEHDWPAAIRHARRWLAIDPLHEPAQRQLMLLYAWDNQRAAALRQYQECARILDEELGVPPLAETTALYKAILDHAPPPPPTVPAAQPRPTQETAPPPVPLVGREAEWAGLAAACHGAGLHGRLVVIEGEAGIGKTALITAFAAEQARQRRCGVVHSLLRGGGSAGVCAALHPAPACADAGLTNASAWPHWTMPGWSKSAGCNPTCCNYASPRRWISRPIPSPPRAVFSMGSRRPYTPCSRVIGPVCCCSTISTLPTAPPSTGSPISCAAWVRTGSVSCWSGAAMMCRPATGCASWWATAHARAPPP